MSSNMRRMDDTENVKFLQLSSRSNIVDSEKETNFTSVNTDQQKEDTLEIETAVKHSTLIYGISDNPPLGLTVVLAFQQTISSVPKCLFVVALLAEVVCATNTENFKIQMFSSTILLSGLCTFVQSTFGIRLPLYQGPITYYILPLIALSSLPEWKCPDSFIGIAKDSSPFNTTIHTNISDDDFMEKQHLFEQTYVFPKLKVVGINYINTSISF
ncbi:solute carrier family 23 member 1-like [Pecten maximus]|uniref:solute carrier family 23 member 1-like n=1 Tax=Pecten maximus TaxID=6579 RepID=UPI0014582294|nr:solute carrier family 23 member 1-like [Pecten maximus]